MPAEATGTIGRDQPHSLITGGVIPRGADAVVMIEQTELVEESQPRIELNNPRTRR